MTNHPCRPLRRGCFFCALRQGRAGCVPASCRRYAVRPAALRGQERPAPAGNVKPAWPARTPPAANKKTSALYFKICPTCFKICQTYFRPCIIPGCGCLSAVN